MLKKTLSLLLTLCLLLAVIPMANAEHVHTYVERVYEATCKEPEYHIMECTTCFYSDESTGYYVGEKLAHNYVEKYREDATCTTAGTILYMCFGCEDSYEESIGEPLGHDYEEVDRTDATCTTDGSVTYTCKREGCGYSETKTLPATGHDQTGALAFVEPTCTEPETKYVACSKCGTLQLLETIGEPLGHNYVETARTNATCTAEGSVTYVCDRTDCGATYTETLAALGHSYVESARTDATCTAEGSVTYTCTREGCGASYTEPLAAIGHSYAESSRTPAYCAMNGSIVYTCANCGESYTETLSAFGHNWTTTDGYTYKCTRCGMTEVDEEAKAEAEAMATPIPNAYGNINENDQITDLTLTSAIKEVGGGYSLRREEATLNSISLAAERDPENSWMRLTASEPAKQLGMRSSFIGNNMTLTLTENDEELIITGVSIKEDVLTITTSSGATFELSSPGVSLGYTELDTITEKKLDRIVFKRMGNVLMIDFACAATLKAEVEAALATPTPEVTPSPTPSPTPIYKVDITFSKRTITSPTPAPTPTPTPRPTYQVTITFSKRTIRREETPTPVPVIIEPEEECQIVIIAYDDEEEVETYERSNCTHRWVYAEEGTCQSARTCELCGKHEDTPSEHCWYCWKKVVDGKSYDMDTQITGSTGEILYDYVVSTYILKCRYCDATMEESSLNQVVGKCTHPRLKERYNMLNTNGQGDEYYTWCTQSMKCPDCQSQIAAVGHNWKITGEDGDYYTAVCQRCKKTVKANKKYYNSSKDKLDTSEMSCVDDPNNHAWVTVDSNGCKKTLVCSNCGTQTTTDHDWKVTRQNACSFTAVCQKCGKTEKATIHRKIDATSVSKGIVTHAKEPGNKYERIQTYAYCTVCGKTLASETIDLLCKSNTSIDGGKITGKDNEQLSEYKHSDLETEKMEKLMKKLGVDQFPTTFTLPVYFTDGYINSQSQ